MSEREIRRRRGRTPTFGLKQGSPDYHLAQAGRNSREVRSLVEELASAETGHRFPVKYQVANDEGLALLMRLAAAREGLGTLFR